MKQVATEANDAESLAAYASEILSKIDKVDLKSYSFDKDPDYKASFV